MTDKLVKTIEKFDRDTRAVHHEVLQRAADRNEAVAIVCMVLAQLLRSGLPTDEREPLLIGAMHNIRYFWDMLDDVEFENAAGGEQ